MIDVGTPIRQGAQPHARVTLGHSKRTIAGAGCLLACFVMAARALSAPRDLGLLEAHDAIRNMGGFLGSSLRRSVAAKTLGLRMPRGVEPFDMDAVRAELAAGRPVIAGTDYREGASSTFSLADHFVLAVAVEGEGIRCADPASGAEGPAFVDFARATTTYRGHPATLTEMVRLAPLTPGATP